MLTLLFIFFGLGILGAIISGDKPTKANGKQVAQQAQNQPATSTPQPHIGTTVSDAGFNFVVNSIKCGETHLSTGGLVNYYSNAQGQYCRLNITVTNTGNTANSITAYNQYVFNAQGQRYTYASDATATAAGYAVGTPLNDDINPGNSVTGDIVYDVPVGVTPTVAEVHGDYNSLGVKVNLQ
ncbi:MAG TPA: DUF4352 domain-containing protein [Patescibacteria group bacterium]|nr:DUF4352 domain-containing protein [Patescibacteria group bacterium]